MLTEGQIQYLYKFCVKHYVRYYDVQVELVDHLAASIEHEMEQDAKLSFEEALNKVYRRFGISGFASVVADKEASLQGNYRKNFWLSFLSYFTIPRIVITCLIFCLLNAPVFLLENQNVGRLFIFYCIAAGIIGIGGFIYTASKYKRPKKPLLMLESGSGAFGVFAVMLQLPNFYFNIFLGFNKLDVSSTFSVNQVILVTGVFTLISLLFLAYYETYKSLQQKARRDFPLAFE